MNRALRVTAPAVLVVVAFAALIAALQFGGAAAAPLLNDPGAGVRWGLPAAKLIVNLGAAGMIGSLVLVCFGLSDREKEQSAALDVAAASAGVMTVASAVTGFLTYLSVTGIPVSDSREFSDGLSSFITSISLGQAWLWTTLMAATVTVLCFAVRNKSILAFVTIFALVTLLPMAQQGHAAGTSGHDQAVTALGLHLVFAAVWLGGLLTVVIVHRTLTGARLVTVIERYSTLAIVCFVVVAASGYMSAELRIGTLANLLTPYGILVLVKAAALVALGLFGVLQRRWLIERLRSGGDRRVFWWLVTAELAFMGIASGAAAALARTATPVAEVLGKAPTPAEILTGDPLPPPVTALRYLTSFNVDLLWLLACAFGTFFYLAGVWRLHRRGDRWPVLRTVSWVAGMLLLLYVTNGGINVYEKYLFSAHMTAHMVLTMMIPVLLVPGAPVTLAARAIHKRTDDSRGPREWILWAVHSKVAAVLANPIVAAVLFVGSLWVFYFSPIFSWATTDHIGHEWMIIHFIITGYLFVQSLIGIDPVPYRAPYPLRLVLLLATMGFHAFFGIVIMNSTGLFLADWYGAMGRTWGQTPMGDQQTAGGIAWSIGEIPTLALAIAVALQWARSDEKESRRRDRNADRTGDAELNEYNAQLARLAERD
ncbi:cytochrome c oxidase assembly protein [Microbacterium sp. STN6]|uniref:cytochrome c oxidase assembly protein n=1 Tax=Microbacterium sp. STN6 TaxID=2995588 RepID=UPI002260967B|nr:cytochrome c oxidase assembly protein [Microbacterium sp. STN6]MCX7522820.1 cytochrome c oxidase assembly protein [Microbacterium sp. STN6]